MRFRFTSCSTPADCTPRESIKRSFSIHVASGRVVPSPPGGFAPGCADPRPGSESLRDCRSRFIGTVKPPAATPTTEGSTTISQLCAAEVPSPFVAVTDTVVEVGDVAVGDPVIAPVEVLIESPLGNPEAA